MYARVTIARPRPDHFDHAAASVRESFYPAARAQPGYSGFQLLVDRDQHQLIGISFWDSEAQLHASGAPDGYYAEQMETFGDLLTEPPITNTYEVIVRDE